MTEIPFFPRGLMPSLAAAARRTKRGVLVTARVGWVVVKILGFVTLGFSLAIIGVSIAASSSNVLTSSDKVLLVMMAGPSAQQGLLSQGRDAYVRGRDAYAPRTKAATKAPTAEESLFSARMEALISFASGLFIACLSLAGFAGSWCEVSEAFDSYRERNKKS